MTGFCSEDFFNLFGCSAYIYVLVALVAICLLYNHSIDQAFESGHQEITVILVIIGVLLVLTGYAIIRGLFAALEVLSLFVVSGSVMTWGAWRRTSRAKDKNDRELFKAVEFVRENGQEDA